MMFGHANVYTFDQAIDLVCSKVDKKGMNTLAALIEVFYREAKNWR
jgi:hypothetical protein